MSSQIIEFIADALNAIWSNRVSLAAILVIALAPWCFKKLARKSKEKPKTALIIAIPFVMAVIMDMSEELSDLFGYPRTWFIVIPLAVIAAEIVFFILRFRSSKKNEEGEEEASAT